MYHTNRSLLLANGILLLYVWFIQRVGLVNSLVCSDVYFAVKYFVGALTIQTMQAVYVLASCTWSTTLQQTLPTCTKYTTAQLN